MSEGISQEQGSQNAPDGNGRVRNQNDIETRASELTGVHKDTVKTVFNAVWDAICEELENGNEVKLHGKGTFYLSRRSSRVGRNPLTGEEFDVPEREAMAFRTSPAYARRLRERRKELAKKNRDNKE
ncbi:HU family DNA-binding protein [Shouchella clausii]|uniref:HU family DNA-binding protein n=1 Tax=Shouchella clausii TaxID=79880 RepID=A0A268S4D8_SHOCL|nr:HU family DNA-binding protein [Shouchella clausii]PAF27360.1 HU family DNA-binding protein [Shouchella clausii]